VSGWDRWREGRGVGCGLLGDSWGASWRSGCRSRQWGGVGGWWADVSVIVFLFGGGGRDRAVGGLSLCVGGGVVVGWEVNCGDGRGEWWGPGQANRREGFGVGVGGGGGGGRWSGWRSAASGGAWRGRAQEWRGGGSNTAQKGSSAGVDGETRTEGEGVGIGDGGRGGVGGAATGEAWGVVELAGGAHEGRWCRPVRGV